METTNAEHYGKKIIAALYLVLLSVSLYFTLVGNSSGPTVSRVRSDLPTFVGAIEGYYVDDLHYPAMDAAVKERTSGPVPEQVPPTAPEQQLLISNTYDPTNGITIMGDVYRVKQ